MLEIAGMVEEFMGPLCREYGLRIVALDPSDILLIGKKFAIRIFVEPYETFSFDQYIDIPDAPDLPMQRYAVGEFLGTKRPMPPRQTSESFAKLSQEQGIRCSIEAFALILAAKGRDILRGEKEWLRDWFQPPRPVEQRIVDAIRQHSQTRDASN